MGSGASKRILSNWPVSVYALIPILLIPALIYLWAEYQIITMRHGLFITNGNVIGHDFLNIWVAAKLALGGQTNVLFDLIEFHRVEEIMLNKLLMFHVWSYPPHFIPLLLTLGLMPYPWALGLWTIATLIIYLVAVAYKRPQPWILSLALALAPSSFENINGGQTGFLTAAFLVGGLRLLEARPIAAGILFGLLTIKPQLGLLVPVALIAGRHWKCFLSAAATTIFLIALSILLWGLEPWRLYLDSSLVYEKMALENLPIHVFSAMSLSPFMSARLLGLPLDAAYAIALCCAAAAVYVVGRTFAKPFSSDLRSAVLLTATFLATPYVLDYDTPALSAAVIAVLAVAGKGSLPKPTLVLLMAMATPMLIGWFHFNSVFAEFTPTSDLFQISIPALVMVTASLLAIVSYGPLLSRLKLMLLIVWVLPLFIFWLNLHGLPIVPLLLGGFLWLQIEYFGNINRVWLKRFVNA